MTKIEKERAIADMSKVIVDKKMYINEKQLYRKFIEFMLENGYYLTHESILSKIELENVRFIGE